MKYVKWGMIVIVAIGVLLGGAFVGFTHPENICVESTAKWQYVEDGPSECTKYSTFRIINGSESYQHNVEKKCARLLSAPLYDKTNGFSGWRYIGCALFYNAA